MIPNCAENGEPLLAGVDFEVEEMPVTVAVDVNGTSVHRTGPAQWQQKIAEAKAVAVT